MTYDDDDQAGTKGVQPDSNPNPFNREQRQQAAFSGMDEDDEDEGYEEPERDTDYTSGYREDGPAEDEFDELLIEADEDSPDEYPLGSSSQVNDPQDNDPLDDGSLSDTDEDNNRRFAAVSVSPEPDPTEMWDQAENSATVEPDEWDDDEGYADQNEEDSSHPWPMSLIAVAIVALLLLAAGGYGVMQQRSETQEEIRELRAELATATTPDDVSASRTALQEMKQRNAGLTAEVDTLTLVNRRLVDTVAGLEAQLEAQQATALAKVVAKPAPKPSTSKPSTPEPVAAKTTASSTAASSGSWFVNFGSYGQRATAETWSTKLQPASGKVILATGDKGGRTYYRVRVVELNSRDAAEKVARKLESEYGLSKLWIGQQ